MKTQIEITPITSNSAARLRILMVVVRFSPFMGGLETHVYEAARRLVQQGVDVTVLTTNPAGNLPAEEILDGIKVLRVQAWPAYRDFGVSLAVFKIIKEGHWDVVHCQGYHTLFAPVAMLAARLAKIPYLVTFHSGGHSSRLRNAIRGVQRQVLRPLLAGAAKLVAVSEFEAEFFQEKLKLPATRFVIIPNGASLPELSEESNAITGPELIVSVGRLERYKGHHRVIQAFPDVARKYPNARLHIVGSGPYESELRQLTKTLGIETMVEIGAIPATDRQGMAEILAKASLVVLLSDYEAHPLAVMEALAMKRPVLVTDTSGLGEIARKGWVRSIPLNSSVGAISRALISQLEHPLIAIGFELPTWERCAADLLNLYNQVSDKGSYVLSYNA